MSVVSAWSVREQKFPRLCISQQDSRTALLFFFTTALLSCGLLCREWIQVLRAMLWYVCSGRGAWTSVAGLGVWHNNLSHSTSWKSHWSSWAPRQMYDGCRLFLLDFPMFLFQIRCTRGLLLESLIWKGTSWNDCPIDGFLLCSNSRLSVSSLVDFKSRKVASLEPKFNPTDSLLPSACVPTRRLFSALLPDPLKKKKSSACIISSHGLKSPGSSRLTRQVDRPLWCRW